MHRGNLFIDQALTGPVWLRLVISLFVAVGLIFSSAGSAQADVSDTEVLPGGAQRTTYRVGPINVTSGQNRIVYDTIKGADRPTVDGWITRIKPDLVRPDGTVPLSSKIMFHHGVWSNQSASPPEQFYGTGEEKTILELPDGYGYRYQKSDKWVLNHMIHNLVPQPTTLYVTYTIDFIPDDSPAAANITRAKPIWMDVEDNRAYPVFDVHRGSGGKSGEFTYPQDADDPYRGGHQKNEKLITKDGVLIWTTGHVHTGGLSTDLYLQRNGAGYEGEICEDPVDLSARITRLNKRDPVLKSRSMAAHRRVRSIDRRLKKLRAKAKRNRGGQARKRVRKRIQKLKRTRTARRKRAARIDRNRTSGLQTLHRLRTQQAAARKAHRGCLDSQPSVTDNRVNLFESKAEYFDPRGPVSWDMAMFSTDQDWKVAVKAGDLLEIQTTYETERASWYESMGINIVYMAEEEGGKNPYATKVDTEGVLNHGHYPENEDYGGESPTVGPDPRTLADGLSPTGPFTIGGYRYQGADFRLPGEDGLPPVVSKGQSFTFNMSQSDVRGEIWHSLTSCKAPCNKSTGISYPIPDGEFQFDSGQMGTGGDPTVNRTTWTTPDDLPVGTHTFFCRIHPLMRGAVRVKP